MTSLTRRWTALALGPCLLAALLGSGRARAADPVPPTAAPAEAPAPAAAPAPAKVAKKKAAPPPAPTATPVAKAHKTSQYHTQRLSEKAKQIYASIWGIEDLRVSSTSAGNLIRFSYRVVDVTKAGALTDKKLTPYLYGETSHALLSIPVMEKIGPLRQSMPPVAGQDYWMVFSNKGHPVKPGDRVDVTIGSFRADGLLVE
jgi:hypothetical protein